MSDEQLHKIIIDYLQPYKPERIGLFGSFARGENSDESDIDILVSFQEPCSLIQLVRFENELGDLIGKKVDLVTDGALRNERIRKSLQQDLHVIYEA